MIKYPVKKKNTNKNVVSHQNRGMDFEAMINDSNLFYAEKDIAYIYKKPTPIKVHKVDYYNSKFEKSKHRITEAYFSEQSTTDYNGIYKGYYIDFEAKTTRNKTFNLGANLKKHQLEHLIKVAKHGAIAFLLIYFQKYDKVYVLNVDKIVKFLEENEVKSLMPIDFFEDNGYVVEKSYNPELDYIKVLDVLIEMRGACAKK